MAIPMPTIVKPTIGKVSALPPICSTGSAIHPTNGPSVKAGKSKGKAKKY